MLASIPARGTGLAEATAKAKQALARGSRGVGVLDSAKFASLHPGYYVVFAGVYDSLDEAQTAATRLVRAGTRTRTLARSPAETCKFGRARVGDQ